MRPLRIASQPFGLIWWFENAVVGTLGGPGQTQDARPQFIIVRLEKARAKDVHLFFFFFLALCRPGNNLRRCPGSVHGTCLRRALSTNLSERTWPDGHCSTPSSSIWAVSSHAVATTSPIPPATLQHIKDRNKADSMMGFILVVQMTWFLASLCERITQYSRD